MRLGLQLGYWGASPPVDAADLVAEADRLGFDSVWTAEAYGSDALSPLAWWGSRTSRVRLGTALCQLSARAPTATAMAALTMDHLSGGRFVLGLGVSGPQVVEGWYGQPFPRPLERAREYVSIVRKVLEREAPVTNPGPHYPLPYPGGAGLGKPLRSVVHPLRADLPIVLGAEGPKNVALAAEVADGWLPLWFSPGHAEHFAAALGEGFSRPGARRSAAGFEVIASCPVVVDEDVERATDAVRPMVALYVGGMGARAENYHLDALVRMGFEAPAREVQALYSSGHRREAVAAVPRSLVEEVALVGPLEKIRDRLVAWQESIATTLAISPGVPMAYSTGSMGAPGGRRGNALSRVETLRAMAELML
ncbi:MAG: LLM class F420-dependent oxidoreductase [Acidimicrobiales bacterium]